MERSACSRARRQSDACSHPLSSQPHCLLSQSLEANAICFPRRCHLHLHYLANGLIDAILKLHLLTFRVIMSTSTRLLRMERGAVHSRVIVTTGAFPLQADGMGAPVSHLLETFWLCLSSSGRAKINTGRQQFIQKYIVFPFTISADAYLRKSIRPKIKDIITASMSRCLEGWLIFFVFRRTYSSW